MAIQSQIVKLLCRDKRYRQANGTFKIGKISTEFGFDAVLLGPCDDDDLILIENCGGKPLFSLLQKIQALHAALSRSGSLRSLSLILIDALNQASIIDQIRQMVRVLEISTSDIHTANDLSTAVSILLPLPATRGAKLPNGEEMFLKDVRSELTEPLQTLVKSWSEPGPQIERHFLNILEKTITKEGESND